MASTGFESLWMAASLVAAQLTNNVVRYDSAGNLLDIFDPANTAGLNSPQGLTLGPDGNLYVVSSANDRILRYDPVTGDFLGVFADLSGSGHLGPIDLAFGPDGNLYVTGFDNDVIVRINGQTGAILSSTARPAGLGFATAAFGPDGNLYVEGIDFNTFTGGIYRYNIQTNALALFIPEGTGGLQSPGGMVFGPDGNLMIASIALDQNFNDIGSAILKYDGQTGAPIGTLVGAGNGLNIPFFVTTVVPEPSSLTLCGIAVMLMLIYAARRFRLG